MDKDLASPEISVIMPVYNSGLYLKQAIDSILNQSFRDFELFVIDDASTDNSISIIRSYDDKRIKLIEKPKNTGYTDSLNLTIPLVKGRYIARMDSDDIALPVRFERQFQFMENNPDVLVVGTAYKVIDSDFICHPPVGCEQAKLTALMDVPVAHPTVLMRNEIFSTHGLRYNKHFEPTEDYDLWTRVLEYGKIDNLPDILLHYRHHAAQESKTKVDRVLKGLFEIRLKQISCLISFEHKNYDPSFVMKVLAKDEIEMVPGVLLRVMNLIQDLYAGNERKKIYERFLFSDYLNKCWLHYARMGKYDAASYFKVLLSANQHRVTRLGFPLSLHYAKQPLKRLLQKAKLR
jgi:glycosyltransferase involved in cell wall biosynthesis